MTRRSPCAVALALAMAASFARGPVRASEPLPPSQNQFRHPDAAYADDFVWRKFDLTGLRSLARLRAWRRLPDESIALDYEGFEVVVSAPADGVLRLQVHAAGKEIREWAMPGIGIRVAALKNEKLVARETDTSLTLAAGKQQLEFSKTNFALTLRRDNGDVALEWRDLNLRESEHGLSAYARFTLDGRDHFFGLGGKTSPLDRRGRLADSYSVKVADKRGDYGGFVLPFFVNPRGYGLIVNNPWPHVFFDFGYADPNTWSLTTPDGPLDIFLLAGPSVREIVQRYHALTGAPAVPPKWMLGLWVSWLTNSTATDWLGYLRRFREERWPADALVLDLYWRGGMMAFSEGGQGANLEWDRAKFGDGPALIRALHELNVHTVLHVNTRMFAGDVLREGLAKGFLRKSNYDQVVAVLENEAARDWNWRLYAPRVAEGVDAWWVDNGERVDGTLANGLPSRELYGEMWNQFLFERMAAAGLPNRLVLARGGWLGTQTNATQWPGDTSPGVERLREDLWFVGNLAMSGVPFSGVDLGGFNADGLDRDIMHTDENIIRRVAHGFLLFPIPRLHNHEKAPGKFPWRYNEKVQAVYRDYLELRYRLFPYYYSAAVESAKESVPMVRPLVFDFADDAKTFSVDDELLVGPSLLLAPVMETDAQARYVYLPVGEWHNYWTGEKVMGGRSVLVPAKLYARDGLPMFVRHGAIVPSRAVAQFNREEPEEKIRLDLYPADRGNYRLWENAETFSALSYTSSGASLALEFENKTSVHRTYVVTCRDGRVIDAATSGGIPQAVSNGSVAIEVAPAARVHVEAHLKERN